MKKIVTWVFFLLGIVVIIVLLANGIPPALAQRRSVIAAFEHGDLLAAMIAGDPRFSNVRISGQSSSPKGKILAHGTVSSREDAIALRDVVASSAPPVAVLADIHVQGTSDDTWPEIEWKLDPDNEYPRITTRLEETPTRQLHPTADPPAALRP